MYPFNFLVVFIAGLTVIASTDALAIKKNPSDLEVHVIQNADSAFGFSVAEEATRSGEESVLLDNNKRGLLVRKTNKNTKLRRDSSGHSDKSTVIGDLIPALLELYGGILDIAGPVVVEIPVVKDTPLVQSTFPKVASTIPGVIIDLGKTLDNTLHL